MIGQGNGWVFELSYFQVYKYVYVQHSRSDYCSCWLLSVGSWTVDSQLCGYNLDCIESWILILCACIVFISAKLPAVEKTICRQAAEEHQPPQPTQQIPKTSTRP